MAISYIGTGGFASGTGALSVTVPAASAGDLLLLFIETANEAVNQTAPWIPLTGSPQGTGTAAAIGAVRIEGYYRISAGESSGTMSVADSGNHTTAVVLLYRDSAGPLAVKASAGSVGGALTAMTWPSVTTTGDNQWVIHAAAMDTDGNSTATCTGQTNANLTGITERIDQTINSGVGGGLVIWDGVKATAGDTGSSTATGSTAVTHAYLTVAIGVAGANFDAAPKGVATASGTLTDYIPFEGVPYSTKNRETPTSGRSAADIAFGNGNIVVSKHDSGTAFVFDGYIVTTTNEVDWTQHTVSSGMFSQGLVFKSGAFWRKGRNGSSDSIDSSTDGKTWTSQGTPVLIGDVLSEANGRLFCTIPYSGYSGTEINYSDNGTTWSIGVKPAFTAMGPPTFGAGVYLSIGATSAGDWLALTSTDGITFTAAGATVGTHTTFVATTPPRPYFYNGKFYYCPDSTSVYVSEDAGATWSVTATLGTGLGSASFVGLFDGYAHYLVGRTGRYKSYDLKTWVYEAYELAGGGGTCTAAVVIGSGRIAFAGSGTACTIKTEQHGQAYATGDLAGGAVPIYLDAAPTCISTGSGTLTSVDPFMTTPNAAAITYTYSTGGFYYPLKTYYGTGKFFQVTNSTTVRVFNEVTEVLTTETLTGDPYNGLIGFVIYAGGRFVATASAGAFIPVSWTSTDGVNWTASSSISGTNGATGPVTYTGTEYVLLGRSKVYKSTDGLSWTEYSKTNFTNFDSTFLLHDGVFFYSDKGRSTDALTWSNSNDGRGIGRYNTVLGNRAILGSDENTPYNSYLSLNGSQYFQTSPPAGGTRWMYAFFEGVFYCIEYNNSTSTFYTSIDGSRWTTHTLPVPVIADSITAGGKSVFVAAHQPVSGNSQFVCILIPTINRAMSNAWGQLTYAPAELVSAPTATSTASATLTIPIWFNATNDASSSTTAALTTSIRFAGTVGTQASTSASLTAVIRLASTVSAQVSASTDLTATIRLASTATAEAAASADLTTTIHLVSTVSAEVVATAALTAGSNQNLDASVFAGGSASAALTTAIRLAAASTTTTTTAAGLSTQVRMGSTVAAAGTASAALTAQVSLAASPAALGTASAALTTTVRLAATPTASAATAAGLTAQVRLQATAATVGTVAAALTTQVRFATSATASSSTSAALAATILLTGTAAGQASASSLPLIITPLLEAAVAGVATTAADLTTLITLVGTASGDTTSSGTATSVLATQMSAACGAATSVEAELTVGVLLHGASAAAASSTGVLYESVPAPTRFFYVVASPRQVNVAAETRFIGYTR